MPRFDPHYVIERGDAARAYELRSGVVRGNYLGALGAAAATSRPLTSAEQKAVLRQNRGTAQREIDKKVPGKVTINPDGSLHLVNPLTPLNQAMANLLRPSHGLIDASPLPRELKAKLKNQPVTFFIDLFDPVLDAIRDALVEVMESGLNRNTAAFKARTVKDTGVLGVGGFVYDLSTPPFFFTLDNPEFRNVNVWLYQPGDDLFDDESRGILLRMRMLLAYFVLFFRKPFELQTTLAKKGLEFLFGKEDVALVSTTGQVTNSSSTPKVVDMIPGVSSARPPKREGNNLYLVTTQDASTKRLESTYYALSPKGLYQQAVFLREEWDRKYAAYKNDKITNAAGVLLYGPRMTYLRSKGRTEAQARDIIAREDNFPLQFAEARNLPMQFRVLGAPALGGGVARVMNGPKPALPAQVSGLGALGAEPGTTAVVPAAKGAADAGTVAGGGQAGVAVVGAWCGGIAGIITAVGGAVAAIIVALNQPKAGGGGGGGEGGSNAGGGGSAETQSAGVGSSALIVGAGVLAALFFLKGRKA
jgi:hypothetical protein